jgi:hypothetical protein
MIFIFAAGLMLLVGGLTMVLTSAFKKRFLWGMGLLFLPVLVPVYAKFHWLEPRARNGFLIAIIGTLVTIAALYGGAVYEIGEMAETVPDKRVQAQVTKLAQQVPTAGPSKAPLPNEAEAAKIHFPEGEYYDPLSRYEEYAAVDVEPLPSRDSIILNYPDVSNYQYQPHQIGVDELEQHLGKPLKLTTKEGQIKEGKLIETNRKSLLLEIPYEDGFVAFEYKLSNIDTLAVFDLVEKMPPLKAATQVEPASEEVLADKLDTAGSPDGEATPPEEVPAKSSVATVPAPGNGDTLQQTATNQGTVLQIPYASQHDMPDQSGHQPEGTSMDPESTKIRGQNEQ